MSAPWCRLLTQNQLVIYLNCSLQLDFLYTAGVVFVFNNILKCKREILLTSLGSFCGYKVFHLVNVLLQNPTMSVYTTNFLVGTSNNANLLLNDHTISGILCAIKLTQVISPSKGFNWLSLTCRLASKSFICVFKFAAGLDCILLYYLTYGILKKKEL